MIDEIRSTAVLESRPITLMKTLETWHTVQQFRFLPDSYLAAVGKQLDPGMDELVYLRMLIEADTEGASD